MPGDLSGCLAYTCRVNVVRDFGSAKRILGKALASRRAKAELRDVLAERPPLPRDHFEIGVYFADGAVNLYQMRQWYKPLQELNATRPVLVLSRNASGALGIATESSLDVAYVPKVDDLERIVAEQPLHIILYVNQNTRNFQMLRYGQRWHVFINHGESDKMYMTTNQYKTYDFSFIAGDAARKRLSTALWNFDVDARTFAIGRPQADYFDGAVPYPEDDRITVLYAPTWEGDRPAAHYGSVASHGVALAEQVLASPRHRLIYRPHPRSGVEDRDFGKANEAIIAMIARANQADPSAGHLFDESGELGWQLRAPDVAICDISAMIYDRLAVAKPLLVTRPADPRAEVDAGGYLSVCEWLDAADAPSILTRIDALLADPEATEKLRHWSQFHFGDTTPGEPTKRFHAAIESLMQRWDDWNAGAVRNASAT